MTNLEFGDLYDCLYYGHEVEFIINNKRYYLESCDNGYEVYYFSENASEKIESITSFDRSEMIDKLFSLFIFDGKSINDNYNEIEIIAID